MKLLQRIARFFCSLFRIESDNSTPKPVANIQRAWCYHCMHVHKQQYVGVSSNPDFLHMVGYCCRVRGKAHPWFNYHTPHSHLSTDFLTQRVASGHRAELLRCDICEDDTVHARFGPPTEHHQPGERVFQCQECWSEQTLTDEQY